MVQLKAALFSLAKLFRSEFEKRKINFDVCENIILDNRKNIDNDYIVTLKSKHDTEENEAAEGIKITIWIYKDKKTDWKKSRGNKEQVKFETLGYYGSVNFNVIDNQGTKKTLTFDRIGVEMSLSTDSYDTPYNTTKEIFNELLPKVLGYLDTIKDRRNEYKNRVQVPDTNFSINKDKIEEIKNRIMAGGYTFEPSGFGYAIRFTTKLSRRSYGVREATESQKKFFSLNKLYIERSERD